jgi:hypothetical protein
MNEIVIRNLPEPSYRRLKDLADRFDMTVAEFLIHVLDDTGSLEPDDFAAAVTQLRTRLGARPQRDSVDMVRELRGDI